MTQSSICSVTKISRSNERYLRDVERICGKVNERAVTRIFAAWTVFRRGLNPLIWSDNFSIFLEQNRHLCDPGGGSKIRYNIPSPIGDRHIVPLQRDSSVSKTQQIGQDEGRSGPIAMDGFRRNPPRGMSGTEQTPDVKLEKPEPETWSRAARNMLGSAALVYIGYKVARAIAISFVATPLVGSASLVAP